jgi:4-hydroxy-2-oxoheptanedioate aldolase
MHALSTRIIFSVSRKQFRFNKTLNNFARVHTRRYTMEACNRLKTAFAQGKQSMGMWQMIPGANVSRLLARSGVDWVMVDCEHGNIDGMCSGLFWSLILKLPG